MSAHHSLFFFMLAISLQLKNLDIPYGIRIFRVVLVAISTSQYFIK